jgi:hypothetical protein
MKPGDFFVYLCKQVTALCSKCGAAKHMNIRAAQRIRNGQCAWDALVPALILFYSILFYLIIKANAYMHFCLYGCVP